MLTMSRMPKRSNADGHRCVETAEQKPGDQRIDGKLR
jgi:hypothetical protein